MLKSFKQSALVAGSSIVSLLPVAVFADATNSSVVDNFQTNFITPLISIINDLLPAVATLVILFFFWGLAKFVWSAADKTKRDEGKSMMIWASVAIIVMVSIWGIASAVQNIFGIGSATAPTTGDFIPNF